jgi:hypothetical protein
VKCSVHSLPSGLGVAGQICDGLRSRLKSLRKEEQRARDALQTAEDEKSRKECQAAVEKAAEAGELTEAQITLFSAIYREILIKKNSPPEPQDAQKLLGPTMPGNPEDLLARMRN